MLCLFILISHVLLLVDSIHTTSQRASYSSVHHLPTWNSKSNAFSQSNFTSISTSPVSNKYDISTNIFSEQSFATEPTHPFATEEPNHLYTVHFVHASTTNLEELKNLLKRLVDKMALMEKKKRSLVERHRRKKKKAHKRNHKIPKWGEWTDWSSCSVTCGKGRKIKWRQCLHNCRDIETEMMEKTCQLPACGSKLFGIFKL